MKTVIEWEWTIPATVYFLTVTSVQWNGEYLAVSNDDQFSIIVITVLGLVWKMREKFLVSFNMNWTQSRRRKKFQWDLKTKKKKNVVFFRVISAKSFSSSRDFALHLIRKRLNNREMSIIRCAKEKTERRMLRVAIIIFRPVKRKPKRRRKLGLWIFCFLFSHKIHPSFITVFLSQ